MGSESSLFHRKIVLNCLKRTSKVCKIYPKLVQNCSKIYKMLSLGRFGTFSAPFRAQVGCRVNRPDKATTPDFFFWHENGAPRRHFSTHHGSNIMRKSNFRVRSALGLSKNELWEGVWKKHEKSMLKS